MSTTTPALTDLSVPDRHRAIAATFSTVAEGVSDWDAPTPVSGWRARDVVQHLLGWTPGFLASGGVHLPGASPTQEDPKQAFDSFAATVQDLLDGTGGDQLFAHPMAGDGPVSQILDRFYVADVFMHTWDLARSNDVEVDLDPGYARALRRGLESMDQELLRGSGQFGAAVAVPDDASEVDKLIGCIGRDPQWRDEGLNHQPVMKG